MAPSTELTGPHRGLDFFTWGVRTVHGWAYLESLLASAVGAMLVIRTFLGLTGFPRVGGNGLHIAHMLWGGLFMLAAIVVMLTLLGQRVKRGSAVLAGIGFGTFIDELGKFITSDNNYFFRPTIALIYVIFVVLFLIFRQIESNRELSSRALLANAAEVLVSGLSGGATKADVRHGLELIKRAGPSGVDVDALRRALLSLECVDATPSLPARLEALGRRLFFRLLNAPWFRGLIIPLFVAHATVFVVVAFILAFQVGPIEALQSGDRSVAASGDLLASLISSGFIAVGLVRLAPNRLDACRWLRRGVLASILLVQPFLFYGSQFAALGGLAVDLVLLLGLGELIRHLLHEMSTGHKGSVPRLS
jgi:hypothetical protein